MIIRTLPENNPDESELVFEFSCLEFPIGAEPLITLVDEPTLSILKILGGVISNRTWLSSEVSTTCSPAFPARSL